jgi:catechol 2,3-dioxygenase-like lactoylglutathione lyase family enzyme
MIFGTHVVIYSRDAAADRAFFADVLGFESIDEGGGWLIFDLSEVEATVHPAETSGLELFLMSDDLRGDMRALEQKGTEFTEVEEARWGSVTKIRLPGGGEVGLYQPRHATNLQAKRPEESS